jgi:hypothetical protein
MTLGIVPPTPITPSTGGQQGTNSGNNRKETLTAGRPAQAGDDGREAGSEEPQEEEEDEETEDKDEEGKMLRMMMELWAKKQAKKAKNPFHTAQEARVETRARPFQRFVHEPRFDGGDDPAGAKAVLAALACQYTGQEAWYNNNPDSIERVKELCDALTGRAAAWFDNL